jgi:hypothetical protein
VFFINIYNGTIKSQLETADFKNCFKNNNKLGLLKKLFSQCTALMAVNFKIFISVCKKCLFAWWLFTKLLRNLLWVSDTYSLGFWAEFFMSTRSNILIGWSCYSLKANMVYELWKIISKFLLPAYRKGRGLVFE